MLRSTTVAYTPDAGRHLLLPQQSMIHRASILGSIRYSPAVLDFCGSTPLRRSRRVDILHPIRESRARPPIYITHSFHRSASPPPRARLRPPTFLPPLPPPQPPASSSFPHAQPKVAHPSPPHSPLPTATRGPTTPASASSAPDAGARRSARSARRGRKGGQCRRRKVRHRLRRGEGGCASQVSRE
ncbi:hypothetical protein B0H12DRAFT_1167781 [Mycena haematopus]|nr:hypothetical protein B0H12DRAFT_1167781 [Mycena haematopus]